MYRNRDCILLEGAELPFFLSSHQNHGCQGAKTKLNLELNIHRPDEGAEWTEMLISALCDGA